MSIKITTQIQRKFKPSKMRQQKESKIETKEGKTAGKIWCQIDRRVLMLATVFGEEQKDVFTFDQGTG